MHHRYLATTTPHAIAWYKGLSSLVLDCPCLDNSRSSVYFMGREIPPEVLAVSPVSSHPRHSSRGLSLPLNILALIISYVSLLSSYKTPVLPDRALSGRRHRRYRARDAHLPPDVLYDAASAISKGHTSLVSRATVFRWQAGGIWRC